MSAKDDDGWTPLHLAWAEDHVDLVRFLVAHCADVTAKDNDGWILLHLTPCSSDLDLVHWQFLVEYGADMSAKAKDESTLLHGASGSGNVDLAQFLVEPWRQLDNQGRRRAGSASLGIVSRSSGSHTVPSRAQRGRVSRGQRSVDANYRDLTVPLRAPGLK